VLEAAALARALGVLVLLYAAYTAWLIAQPQARDPLPAGAVRPAAGVLSGVVGTMFGAMASDLLRDVPERLRARQARLSRHDFGDAAGAQP
jgi:uncharacterized membrane protein YfcA